MFCIVTGASRGIGFETVKLLLNDPKNKVLAISRSSKDLEKLRMQFPTTLFIIKGDISKKITHSSILSLIKKQTKQVDVLINNAGLLINKSFEKIKKEELENVYEVNVFAPFQLIQLLLPFMGKKNHTHIVNISSMGGVQGSSKFAGLSAYSSSKAAIAGLTECLAEEFKNRNISCNCLALGAVQTEMLQKAFPGYKAPVSAKQMADFVVEFSLTGQNYFNGKIIPVSLSTP